MLNIFAISVFCHNSISTAA